MTVFTQTFRTEDVLRASNVSREVLQQWIRRGLIIGQTPSAQAGEGLKTGKQGLRRTFTYHQTVEIAVAAALVAGGLSLAHSFKAAASFAHSGNSERRPGLPFADGETFVAVAGDRSFVFDMEASGLGPARHYLGEPVTMTLLNATRVVDRVIASLGRRPQEEIEAAYTGGHGA